MCEHDDEDRRGSDLLDEGKVIEARRFETYSTTRLLPGKPEDCPVCGQVHAEADV